MSLKMNAVANSLCSFYVTMVGILIIPLYISYLGPEVYGLVGFFALLQQWLRILDLGLTPALSREVTRQRAGAISADSLKSLIRSLEFFFVLIALLIAAILCFCNSWIANSWIKNESIPYEVLSQSILLMSLTIPLRWILSMYRSGLTGMEKHVWLNGFNIAFATLRAFGVLLVLEFISNTPVAFFAYQTLVVVLEALVLISYFYASLPQTSLRPGFSLSALKKVFPFAGSIAITSAVWLMITQSDKLILSNLLSLKDFGYFTLATTAAYAIGIFSEPISRVLLPRMTFLLSQNREAEMVKLYRRSTQFVLVITASAAAILAAYGEPVIFLWVGNVSVARAVAPVLFWYALGNGILSLLALQYYLQFAYGNLKYHLRFNIVSALFWVPIIWLVASKYGAVGAGKIWFLFQLLTFLFWPWYIHHKLVSGLHSAWLREDVMPIILSTTAGLGLSALFFPDFAGLTRLQSGTGLIAVSGFMIMVCVLSSSACRELIQNFVRNRKQSNEKI